MPQGSFNISRLINELGLKNVIGMPVSERLQVVLPLDTMQGQVPLHQGPVAMFGGQLPGVVGEFTTWEVQSLDPGGCIVEQVIQDAAIVTTYELTAPATPTAFDTGPAFLPPVQFGATPLLSTVRFGQTIAGVGATGPRFQSLLQLRPAARLFIPRGEVRVFKSFAANTAITLAVTLSGITASEAVPS